MANEGPRRWAGSRRKIVAVLCVGALTLALLATLHKYAPRNGNISEPAEPYRRSEELARIEVEGAIKTLERVEARRGARIAFGRNARVAIDHLRDDCIVPFPIIVDAALAVWRGQKRARLRVIAVHERRCISNVVVACQGPSGERLELKYRLPDARVRHGNPLYWILVPVEFAPFERVRARAKWSSQQRLFVREVRATLGGSFVIPDPSACEIAVAVEDFWGRRSSYVTPVSSDERLGSGCSSRSVSLAGVPSSCARARTHRCAPE